MFNRRTIPDQPTGAPIGVSCDIVVPESTINLFLNPSWETNTSNWAASNDGSGGTPYQRSTGAQFKGAYSAQLTIEPTNGTYVQIVNASVSNATQYTISFHVRRSNRSLIRSSMAQAYVNGGLVDFDSIASIGDGWYRCVKTFTSTSTSGVGIRVIGTPNQIFYVDAAQLEAKGYPTTYCDGDQAGLLPIETPPPFYWTGVAHASTSVRSATTRAGGRPVNIRQYGLTLLALIGLGMTGRSVIATPLGLADGSIYQRTVREARTFTMAGAFGPNYPRPLSAQRGAFRAALEHDRSGLDQPVVLRLQRDGGDQATIVASYLGGLEETYDNEFEEKVSVQFQQWLPALTVSDRGAALSAQTSVSNANYIIQRSSAGAWQALSTGMNSVVSSLKYGPDGYLYAAGIFTTSGGVTTNYIARWNGSTWSAISGAGGADSSVNDIAFAADGTLYATGQFTTIGGVSANRIARWDGSAWNAMGAGLNDGGFAVVVGNDGNVYVGGEFTSADGVANTTYIARWSGSNWNAMGTGANNYVQTLAVGLDGLIYAGGDFNLISGAAAGYIAAWNGSSWSTLNGGMAGGTTIVEALAVGLDGLVYAGGVFTSAGGISAEYIAAWNGAAWSPLGTGVGNRVTTLGIGPVGELYAGGTFGTAGGITLPDRAAVWDGSSWSSLNVDLPGTATLDSVVANAIGDLVVSFSTTGTATAASVTTVTNPGTIPCGFTLTITGPTSGSPANLYSLTNNTTGKAIYFNTTVLVGETLTLTAENGIVNLTSSFRGNLNSAIVPASDTDMELVRGSNSLSFFAANATMTAVIRYTPQYESLDDLTLTVALP